MKKHYSRVALRCRQSSLILLLFITLTTSAQESMRANLFIVDPGGLTLVDGNLTNYNNMYSNEVDINDAWKMANPGINFGIYRSATNLVVERRSIYNSSDTTYFRMWNMQQKNYRIKFMLKNLNHPGMYGFVKDNYLNTVTQIGLNDTTYFDFSVTAVPASAAELRFQLIYGPQLGGTGAVPVNITGLKATRKDKDVLVEWNVVNESSIASYTVEYSADGRHFKPLNEVAALNTPVAKTYNYIDHSNGATAFYRIKANNLGGKTEYSNIARLNAIGSTADISVYPNPVVNKTAQLQMTKMAAGRYNITLLSSDGVQYPLSSIQVTGSQSSHSLTLPYTLVPGIYQMKIIGTDNKPVIKKIQVL